MSSLSRGPKFTLQGFNWTRRFLSDCLDSMTQSVGEGVTTQAPGTEMKI